MNTTSHDLADIRQLEMTQNTGTADALLASGWILLDIAEDHFLLGRALSAPIDWVEVDKTWRKARNLPPPTTLNALRALRAAREKLTPVTRVRRAMAKAKAS